jgi:Putative zinc-finger
VSGEGEDQLLGAYLLGGLDPAEAAQFEQHLKVCENCRKELERLEGIPALLDAIPVPDAVALTERRAAAAEIPERPLPVSPVLLDELAAARKKARRRWSTVVATVAAACLALGFASGPLLNPPPPKPDATYSVEAENGLQFSVALVKKTWGTELAVNGQSLPRDGTLSIWVKDRAGTEDRACAWSATPSGRVRVTGATPVQLTSISHVEVRNEQQQAVAAIAIPAE